MNKALAFMVALALTSPGPAQTVERLPQKFIGTWCREDSSTESLSTHQRRKQCEWAEDEFIILADHIYVAGEVECKILKIEAVTSPAMYKVRSSCRHFATESKTWENVTDYWQIKRGRLVTRSKP
jgi:hypothetical protein